ncbi:MAG: AtpZ/AtpI family protein [Sphingobacteriaceae bacterium]|nr:AtpZ/AtpI family protein [Sphingobacteriaceae bacterium]
MLGLKSIFFMTDFHKDNKEKSVNTMIKYSAMGFQMICVIVLFAFLGNYIDKYFKTELPLYTAFFSLFGVVVSMVQIIKQVIKK